MDQSLNCELTVIDGKKDNSNYVREYAIGLQTGSNLTNMFNDAIRQLRSTGKLDRLKRKYWNQKCNGSHSKYSISSMATIVMIMLSFFLLH